MKVRQSTSFLFTLLREVEAGRMLPAAMQRPYVWLKPDVEALCDSILSGFPVGAFVIWEPGQKADITQLAKARLGPIQPGETSVANPYMLLLDGQNRLATLAWMSVRTPLDAPQATSEAERETWLSGEQLVVDFATKSVKFVPCAEAALGLRLPAWTLVSDSSKSTHHEAMQLTRRLEAGAWKDQGFTQDEMDDFMRFWELCKDRFREARTVETVIQNATTEEARHAFLRICRVGVPMSQEDFDQAVGWTQETVCT